MLIHLSNRQTQFAQLTLASILALLLVAAFAGPAAADTFVVNSIGDAPDTNPGDGNCYTGMLIAIGVNRPLLAQECTLRAALDEANSDPNGDVIQFSDLLPLVSGRVTLSPNSALPPVFTRITIDGTSHPSYDDSGPHPIPVINLIGNNAGSSSSGLVIVQGANGTIVRGLAISSFARYGIAIGPVFAPSGPQGVRIEANDIGIQYGLVYNGNGWDGIRIEQSEDVIVGTRCNGISGCQGVGNLISGNQRNGIGIDRAVDTRIAGNLIGTNRTGTLGQSTGGIPTGNHEWGIEMVIADGVDNGEIGSLGSSFILGGGSVPDASGNVISGNQSGGVRVTGGTGHISVMANKIGTDVSGMSAVANNGPGMQAGWSGASPNASVIGSEGLGSNVFSGNTQEGLVCSARVASIGFNTIGVNADESGTIPNGTDGFYSYGDCWTFFEHNIVGGNRDEGIYIESGNAGNGVMRILDNLVGTNAAGLDLGNESAGIVIDGFAGSDIATIGAPGRGNTIGFNSGAGILLVDESEATIQGNFIGTNASGEPLGNGRGIWLIDGNARIGEMDGRTSGSGNVIGHNLGSGVEVESISVVTDSWIRGNYVGTNANGDDLGNARHGIAISFASGIEVGADLSVAASQVERYGNEIAGNAQSGITFGPNSESHAIRGNRFSANPAGAISLSSPGPTPNDFGDTDVGANRRQNTPEFDTNVTTYDEATGNLLVRYRVDSNLGDAAYPLTVDFYTRSAWMNPGAQAQALIGSDTYPAASASAFRSVAITPLPGSIEPFSQGLFFETIVATATDANGNTSELSVQPVSVPEPKLATMLFAGLISIALSQRAPTSRAG